MNTSAPSLLSHKLDGWRGCEDRGLAGEFGFKEATRLGGIPEMWYKGWSGLECLQVRPIDALEEGVLLDGQGVLLAISKPL